MFRKTPILLICHLGNFDGLIRDFGVIANFTFANLCKLVQDIIIAVSSDPFFLETGKEGKKYKKWISQDRKELFRWSKKHFS